MNLGLAQSDGELRFARARAALIEYLMHKIDAKDWHAVADAAMDLRELEAEKRGSDKSDP
jgi:hypothetical protein